MRPPSPVQQLDALTLLVQESVQRGLIDDLEPLLERRQALVDEICGGIPVEEDQDIVRRIMATEAHIVSALLELKGQSVGLIQEMGKTKAALASYRRSSIAVETSTAP